MRTDSSTTEGAAAERAETRPEPQASAPSFAHDQRLRALPRGAPFRIVLVEPEIPPNTGNIARLCAATCSELHLIHPLGFSVDEKSVRRAGLDYWHLVHVTEHNSWTDFEKNLAQDARLFFFTGKARTSFLDVAYSAGDYLVFGKESSGLADSILSKYQDQLVAIPTLGQVRSLNLANAATLAIYEAHRQLGNFADAQLQTL